jgi:hypothetical protein
MSAAPRGDLAPGARGGGRGAPRAIGASIGLAALLAAAVAPATEPLSAASAAPEARLDPDSVGIPSFGVVFEGGSESRKLTGRAALRYGAFALDATLSGADVDSAGRSRVFGSLDPSPTGALTIGLTWTSFRVHDYDAVFDQLERLCEEEEAVLAAKAKAALAEDEGVAKATEARAAREAEERAALDHGAAEARALDEARGRASAAGDASKAAWERARQAALAVENLAKEEKKPRARGPVAEAARRRAAELDEVRAKAATLALEAQVAADEALRAAGEVARLEARVEIARRDAASAASAKRAADEALSGEQRRAGEPFRFGACAASKLSPERRARIDWPFAPTSLVALRASVGTQAVDFYDAATGEKRTDDAHPFKLSLGLGSFLTPTALVATTPSYGRARVAGPESLVCEPSEPTAPAGEPVYACSDLSVGEPVSSSTTAIRLEYRQYLVRGLSTSPSFTYAWSGSEEAPFAPSRGAWQLDLPAYLRLGGDDGVDKSFVVGAAFAHKATWGRADGNQSANDVTLFLGGALDAGRL